MTDIKLKIYLNLFLGVFGSMKKSFLPIPKVSRALETVIIRLMKSTNEYLITSKYGEKSKSLECRALGYDEIVAVSCFRCFTSGRIG